MYILFLIILFLLVICIKTMVLNGFESKQFLPPDYKYVVAGRRVHKFNYRKERFKSDPNLYYEEGLTEEELAEENGLIRVYDAGNIKWYKKL